MIRKFTVTNSTNFPNLSPAKGRKWKVLSAVVVLQSGTGSGTRAMTVLKSEAGSGKSYVITTTGNQTVTSSTFMGNFGPNGASGFGTNYFGLSTWPIITEYDLLAFSVTLISGDVGNYYIIVEDDSA